MPHGYTIIVVVIHQSLNDFRLNKQYKFHGMEIFYQNENFLIVKNIVIIKNKKW